MVQPGILLQGRYCIVRKLGGGGMGAVYLAEDDRLPGRRCAIKEMSPSQVPFEDRNWAITNFRQEAQMLANLKHPGLTPVTDCFAEYGNWYLVMDYIEGETLQTYLSNHRGRLRVDEALHIINQLCEVLHYLHTRTQPVIFRDLKPGNVMLTPQGEVKLIDFGIARFFKPGKAGDTVNLGTPGYAAPEQYGRMGLQSGPRADVYSLGIVLLQMLSGYDPTQASTPFPLPDIHALLQNTPAYIQPIIMRATEMKPELRYSSIWEMQQALFSVPQPAQPTPVLPKTRVATPGGANHRRLFVGGGLGILTILVMLWVSGAFKPPVPTPPPTIQATSTIAVPKVEEETKSPPVNEKPTDTPSPEPIPTSTRTPTKQPTNPPATLPPPPTVMPERIAFVRVPNDTNRDGKITWDDRRIVYVMNTDGSNLYTLTGAAYDAYTPSWSPDGSRIVFAARHSGYWNIYMINADGSGLTQLTNANANDEGPAWSPDGQRIAFHSNRDGDTEIYTMYADGSHLTQLTFNNAKDTYPVWAPDSQSIAFCSERDGNKEIYVMNKDGSGQRNLTQHTKADYWPAWSPDNNILAFMSDRDGRDDVYLYNLQHNQTSRLTARARSCVSPTWSPGGDWLAFTCWTTTEACEIYRMRLNDGHMEQLTNHNGLSTRPAWSP